MEFFPRPTDPDPILDAIEFPYEGYRYDCDDFWSYPESQGMTKGDLLTCRVPNAAQHLQTWFYFGLLNQVLGPINQHDFLRVQSSGCRPIALLTTVHLEKYGQRWRDRVSALSQSELERIYNPHLYIQFVFGQLAPTRLSNLRECLGPRMYFSIYTLALGLSDIVDFGFFEYPFRNPAGRKRQADDVNKEFVNQLLRSNQWCPREIRRIDRPDHSLALKIYCLGLRREKRYHHDHCDEFDCFQTHIDEDAYQTQHVWDTCDCSEVSVDVDKVKSILSRPSGIPLVQIQVHDDDSVRLKVVDIRSRRYVAVSHVWSDGIGNPRRNSLPTCQLRRIAERGYPLLADPVHMPVADSRTPLRRGVDLLKHTVPRMLERRNVVTIWMDTLCVPLDETYRKIAIRRMKDCYARAYRVMVLDRELFMHPHNNVLESFLRILTCSNWMYRLWTLQEGIFARGKAYVCFENVTIRLASLMDRPNLYCFMSSFSPFGSIICSNVTGEQEHASGVLDGEYLQPTSILQQLTHRWKPTDRGTVISRVCNSVQARQTSKDSDRPVVMASVLELDVSRVLAIPARPGSADGSGSARPLRSSGIGAGSISTRSSELDLDFGPEPGPAIPSGPQERMRVVYELLAQFPQDIIFQDGPRFTNLGWRWALSSWKLDTDVNVRPPLRDTLGTILPALGLRVDYSGWIIAPENVLLNIQHENDPYSTSLTIFLGSIKTCQLTLMCNNFQAILQRSTSGLGFLIMDGIYTRTHQDPILNQEGVGSGALVSVYGEHDGAYLARWECRGSWEVTDERQSLFLDKRQHTSDRYRFVDRERGWWVG